MYIDLDRAHAGRAARGFIFHGLWDGSGIFLGFLNTLLDRTEKRISDTDDIPAGRFRRVKTTICSFNQACWLGHRIRWLTSAPPGSQAGDASAWAPTVRRRRGRRRGRGISDRAVQQLKHLGMRSHGRPGRLRRPVSVLATRARELRFLSLTGALGCCAHVRCARTTDTCASHQCGRGSLEQHCRPADNRYAVPTFHRNQGGLNV